MGSSVALYAFVAMTLAGMAALIHPIRWLGIRNRRLAMLVAAVGLVGAWRVMDRPVLASYVTTPATALDEFAPIYEFSDSESIPVRAPASRVYEAIFKVTAADVPLYRTLVWIRRGGAGGPESVLNPADDDPLIDVATRTSFLKLADVPGQEVVLGTVVIAPSGVRMAAGPTPSAFKALTNPGFAKATMNFVVAPQGPDWCILRTEARVHATDPASRDLFTRYWTVITPGSKLIRIMWLRAIKVRAEAPAP
jgi:hypothetical protein